MVLWRGETDAERGFKSVLEKEGLSLDLTLIDGQKSKPNLGELLRSQLNPKLDSLRYVYSFGTTASTMTHTLLRGRVPHVFSIVTDPVKSDLVPSLSECDPNTCGASHGIDLKTQLVTARKVLPFKKLGYLFNPREANSNFVRKELQELAPLLGFEVIDLRLQPDAKNLEKNLVGLIRESDDLDAVYLPLDSFLASNATIIAKTLLSDKLPKPLPSIGAQKEYIESGALLGLVPNYFKLGELAADRLVRHLRGEKFETMKVAVETAPLLLLNPETIKALNMDVPKSLANRVTFVQSKQEKP
jgi:ABC-type uncharacterized transport system substrate-binding protein